MFIPVEGSTLVSTLAVNVVYKFLPQRIQSKNYRISDNDEETLRTRDSNCSIRYYKIFSRYFQSGRTIEAPLICNEPKGMSQIIRDAVR